MSSTILFTPFHSYDYDEFQALRYGSKAGVLVDDPDGLRDALPEPLINQMDTGSKMDDSEYPAKQYELLHGFTSYGGDDDSIEWEYHNIANIEIDRFIEICETISMYTQPFIVWFAHPHHSWPRAAEMASKKSAVDILFELSANDGNVTVDELQIGILTRDLVYDTETTQL